MGLALFIGLFAIEYLGLGYDFPIIRALKVSLVLSFGLAAWLALTGDPKKMFRYRQARLILAFVMFTGLSMMWALVGTHASVSFRNQVGYFVMGFTGVMLITTPARLRVFLYSLVGFHVLLVLMNMRMLLSSARVGVFKAGFFLGDGNDFGWSLNVVVPFALFAAFTDSRWLVRIAALASTGLLVFGIVGTESRGASLALAASLLWFILNSRRKALALGAVALALVGALLVAPARYFERMDSVTSYEQDGSAQGRLRAWRAAAKMAVDYPLGVGAGNFNSAYGRYYRENPASGAWGIARWISPHSIYFGILGEYGFAGVALWLSILSSIFLDNLRGERLAPAVVSRDELPRGTGVYLNMSLIGYAVGGVFLGGVDYPHVIINSFLSIAALSMRQTQAAKVQDAGTEPNPPPASGRRPLRAIQAHVGNLRPRPAGRGRGPLRG